VLLHIFVLAALAVFLEEMAAEVFTIHRSLQADGEVGSRKHPNNE